jgi:hypothetical protein
MPTWVGWIFLAMVGGVVLLFLLAYVGGDLNAFQYFGWRRVGDADQAGSDALPHDPAAGG